MSASGEGFSLIDEPWVLVRGLDGAVDEVSLLELFRRAPELAEIVGDLPTQGFAILRLALAVLHRAVDGPRDERHWQELWDAGAAPMPQIEAYFERFRDRFDLFHPTYYDPYFLDAIGSRPFVLTIHDMIPELYCEYYPLGDPTAAALGRASLNPLVHIDLFGTIIFPLLLILLKQPVFGWAKPVPYNPHNLRHPRQGGLWISFAGPIANIATATAAVVVFQLLKLAGARIPVTSLFSKPIGGVVVMAHLLEAPGFSFAPSDRWTGRRRGSDARTHSGPREGGSETRAAPSFT